MESDKEYAARDPEGKLPHMVKPGEINWMQDTMRAATGCAIREFRDQEGFPAYLQVADFFNKREGRLLVLIQPFVGPEGDTRILCMWTKRLTDEELQEYQQVSRKVDEEMEKWRDEQRRKEEERQEMQDKAAREKDRLAALGATCEQHHAPIVKALREKRKEEGK